MEVIPEQWFLALQLPLKASGRHWWDKGKSWPFDLHMEGWDIVRDGNIKEENPLQGGIRELKEKNTIGTRTRLVTKFKRNIYKN